MLVPFEVKDLKTQFQSLKKNKNKLQKPNTCDNISRGRGLKSQMAYILIGISKKGRKDTDLRRI